jgi:Lon protease-like protein
MKSERVIPIFALSLVQFPGALTPLHIFEPRYRQMLAEVMAGDKAFGILYRGDTASTGEDPAPPSGSTSALRPVGCLVEVVLREPMDDGRSNILCQGRERFEVLRELPASPYPRAEVLLWGDTLPETESEQSALEEEVGQTLALVKRLLAVWQGEASTRGDVAGHLVEQLMHPPEDPENLSLLVAALLDVPLSLQQRWLEQTRTLDRLQEINPRLRHFIAQLEDQHRVERIAKTNGHAHKTGLSSSKDGSQEGRQDG